MPRILVAAGTLAGICLLPSARPSEPSGRPLLPSAIPGYELRVLDERKPILFNVKGSWVEAKVPVFFYFPVGGAPEALRRLRQAHDDLSGLGQKPEWTAEDFRRVLDEIDAAVRALETRPEPRR